MEYRSTAKRLNRSNSSSNCKNVNSRNVSNNPRGNSSKSTQYDLVRFFNTSNEIKANLPNSISRTPAVQDETADVKTDLAESINSEVSDRDDRSDSKIRELTSRTTTLLSVPVTSSNHVNRENNSYLNSVNISSTSTMSSQLFRKNNRTYSKDKLSNSQEIITNLTVCSKSQKRKRRSTLNEKDLLDVPEPKRMQIMDSLTAFIPIASTSSTFLTSGVLNSKTPTSSQNNEVLSLPSSVESSSFNSSFSPVGVNEIDEFIEHEIDARSSSSCLSTWAEFDLVPSSDESTLVLESSTNISQEYEKLPDSIAQIHQCHTTPHKNRALTPSLDIRPCPLPALSWANSSDVWNSMCKTDERAASERTSLMLDNHCGLQPRMRSILLDWLIEVCEVYKLHRETYYLAVDYLDRYLSTQKNVQKTHLQLIGITCLFVAAKVEEIYPPKIGEFAYVTDGACQEEDILQHELLLLSALDWRITPVTIMGWLGIYMQLNINNRSATTFLKNNSNGAMKDASTLSSKIFNKSSCNFSKKIQDKNILCLKENNDINYNNNNYFNIEKDSIHNKSESNNCTNRSNTNFSTGALFGNDSGISLSSGEIDDTFIYPQFSGYEFSQTAQLIDLCTLDLGIADFSYSVIAAAAISHTFGRETAVRVSGYDWTSLSKCYKWMEPFFDIIKEEAQYFCLTEQNEQVQSKQGLGHFCPKIITDDSHMIQTHTTSITMLEKAMLRREHLSTEYAVSQPEVSPAVKTSTHLCPEGLLTPPASSRKPVNVEVSESNVQRKD